MALEFSPETLRKFEETVARYPKREAAMLPVLYLAQQEFGYLSPEAIEYVATLMDQPPARVQGVVSFYTMFSTKPIGRHHIQVCRTLSCALGGAERLTAFIKRKLGIDIGQASVAQCVVRRAAPPLCKSVYICYIFAEAVDTPRPQCKGDRHVREYLAGELTRPNFEIYSRGW